MVARDFSLNMETKVARDFSRNMEVARDFSLNVEANLMFYMMSLHQLIHTMVTIST